MSDTWEISMINPVADERVGLRIILASSSPGEIGADFFCGAGTKHWQLQRDLAGAG